MEALDRLGGALLFDRFDQAPFPAAAARARLAWCLARLGQFADGVVYGAEGVRIAEAADHPFSLVVACLGLGSVYLLKGDLPEAIRVLDRGVDLCRKWTLPAWFPNLASSLGYAYVLSGRLEEGVPLLREAIDEATRMGTGDHHHALMMLIWLSETHLR